MGASQAGQKVVYLRALLRGFGYPQRGATEIWEDNSSCITMSENLTNRDRSQHVDVKVHFLLDLVRDGHIQLVQCAGTHTVNLKMPIETYVIKLPNPFSSKKDLDSFCWYRRIIFLPPTQEESKVAYNDTRGHGQIKVTRPER